MHTSLDGGMPKDIPNLRDKAQRDIWRNNTACTDPKVAGDMLLPCFSKGQPEIEDEIYEIVKQKWDDECKKETGSYRDMAFGQGEMKDK